MSAALSIVLKLTGGEPVCTLHVVPCYVATTGLWDRCEGLTSVLYLSKLYVKQHLTKSNRRRGRFKEESLPLFHFYTLLTGVEKGYLVLTRKSTEIRHVCYAHGANLSVGLMNYFYIEAEQRLCES